MLVFECCFPEKAVVAVLGNYVKNVLFANLHFVW
jgi:hypothetical protein